MSELKAFEVTRKALFGRTCTEKVYLKSEADKYIIEIKQGRLNVEKTLHDLDELDQKEISHHKYKRCLAMAKIAQDDWHLHNSFYAMGHQEFEKRKCDFYEKWRQRWLELAEKFKE